MPALLGLVSRRCLVPRLQRLAVAVLSEPCESAVWVSRVYGIVVARPYLFQISVGHACLRRVNVGALGRKSAMRGESEVGITESRAIDWLECLDGALAGSGRRKLFLASLVV